MISRNFLPVSLVVILALFSLLPEHVIANIYANVGRWFFSLEVWYKSYTQLVSNVGHLLGYGVLVLAIGIAWRLCWWQSGLLAMSIAGSFEAAQLMVPSRQASIGDLCFDFIGIGLVLVTLKVWRYIAYKGKA